MKWPLQITLSVCPSFCRLVCRIVSYRGTGLFPIGLVSVFIFFCSFEWMKGILTANGDKKTFFWTEVQSLRFIILFPIIFFFLQKVENIVKHTFKHRGRKISEIFECALLSNFKGQPCPSRSKRFKFSYSF